MPCCCFGVGWVGGWVGRWVEEESQRTSLVHQDQAGGVRGSPKRRTSMPCCCGWVGGWVGGWFDGLMNRWMDELEHMCGGGWVGGWVD